MRSVVVAVGVGAVFALGVGVGVLLVPAGSGTGAADARSEPPAARSVPRGSPKVAFGSRERDPARRGGPAASLPRGGGGGGGAPPAAVPVPGEPPPSLPPPLPPGARDAQEALRRERAVGDGKPRGRVTPLVYDFASEEERAAWEARYRKRWEDRLRRELEIKLRGLRERVGLQPHQEGALRRILQEELDERARLVGALSRKEITAAEFDAGVRENVRKARTALQELLTPEQREAYAALSPREQVLRDELK